jgi:hypothetical protein
VVNGFAASRSRVCRAAACYIGLHFCFRLAGFQFRAVLEVVILEVFILPFENTILGCLGSAVRFSDIEILSKGH